MTYASLFTRVRLGFLISFATVTFGVMLVWAIPAQGKLCTSCINDMGLDVFYTRSHDTCTGQPIDPINVAWFDFQSTNKIAAEVEGDLIINSNQAWNDEPGSDPQGVRNLANQCGNEAFDVATASNVSPSRNHARIFNTFTRTAWFAVGDAHHDSGLTCHGSSDFIGPKRDIYQYFHAAKHFQNWGNTRPIYQSCLGQTTRSNGWTAVMQATG